jgi:hypothetical protein
MFKDHQWITTIGRTSHAAFQLDHRGNAVRSRRRKKYIGGLDVSMHYFSITQNIPSVMRTYRLPTGCIAHVSWDRYSVQVTLGGAAKERVDFERRTGHHSLGIGAIGSWHASQFLLGLKSARRDWW